MLIYVNFFVFGVDYEIEFVVIKVIDGILGGVWEEVNIFEFIFYFFGYFF